MRHKIPENTWEWKFVEWQPGISSCEEYGQCYHLCCCLPLSQFVYSHSLPPDVIENHRSLHWIAKEMTNRNNLKNFAILRSSPFSNSWHCNLKDRAVKVSCISDATNANITTKEAKPFSQQYSQTDDAFSWLILHISRRTKLL